MRLGLLGGNGQEIDLTLASGERLRDGVVEVTKRTETFRFRDVPSRPVPSLLRGFSAPVNLTIDLPGRRPAVPDGQRQRPLQSLAGGAGLRHARAGRGGEGLRAGKKPSQAARRSWRRSASALGDDEPRARLPRRSSCSCRARATSPASSASDVDPLAIHNGAQRAAQDRSARCCTSRCSRPIARHEVKGPYSPAPERGRPAGAAQRGARLPGEPRHARGRRPRWPRISPTPATPPTR